MLLLRKYLLLFVLITILYPSQVTLYVAKTGDRIATFDDYQNNDKSVRATEVRNWTFMVYLDGDNNLESFAIDDFLEMSSVGSTDDVAIVVLFDRWDGTGSEDDISYGDWTDARIYYVYKNLEPYPDKCNESWGEVDMGDPKTLYRFINYSITNYPAKNYILVLWDHGAGYPGACIDYDNYYDMLDTSEIHEALSEIYAQFGVRIDIVGFDACLMGMLEVAYGLRLYADYVVFSQEAVSSDGWPYDTILNRLVLNASMTPRYLSRVIVEEYIGFYSNPLHLDLNATLSAVNVTSVVYGLYPKLNRLSGYLLRFYDEYKDNITYAMSNAEPFWFYWDRDLGHFLRLLYGATTNATLRTLISQVIDALDDSVLFKGNLTYHKNAYGISIYLSTEYKSDYYFIDSSKHQQWDELTKKIAERDPGIWFYDIWIEGRDTDGNGYLDNITMYIDLDSETPKNVTIRVYGRNTTGEYLMGIAYNKHISGVGKHDVMPVRISSTCKSIYDLSIGVYDEYNSLIKHFHYFCDEDIIGLKLDKTEYTLDVAPPIIEVISPANNSVLHDLNVTFTIEISDESKVEFVRIYVNGSEALEYLGPINSFTLRFDEYGYYIISITATDFYGNTGQVVICITISSKSKSLLEPGYVLSSPWIGAVAIVILLIVSLFLITRRKKASVVI